MVVGSSNSLGRIRRSLALLTFSPTLFSLSWWRERPSGSVQVLRRDPHQCRAPRPKSQDSAQPKCTFRMP